MLIDTLGHPIRVGDTILTGGYYNPTLNHVTKVIKVSKTKFFVEVPTRLWVLDENTNQYKQKHSSQIVARHPHQGIVVTQQLKYNKTNYPENVI